MFGSKQLSSVYADFEISRNVFSTKPMTNRSIKRKIIWLTLAIALGTGALGAHWVSVNKEAIVDTVKIKWLEKWNQTLVEYGLQRPTVELNIVEPVFVDAVVDWAMKRGRGMPNVSRDLIEKYVVIAFAESTNHNVDPLLTLSVMAIESQFNFMATSTAGAKGLMQVIPYWHKEKISVAEVYDPAVNIRAGAQILKEYLDRERGDVNRALLRYNGALHIPGVNYDSKVLAARRDLIKTIEKRFADNYQKVYASNTSS
jgi:soluble lytic murein transglycosylase-like protein